MTLPSILARLATAALLCGAAVSDAAAVTVDETPPSLTNVAVSQDTLDLVAQSLPESRNVDAAFLSTAYDPVLPLSGAANVFVTFVDEGAGYRNSLGYFAYRTGALDGLSKGRIDLDGSGVVSLDELASVATMEVGFVFPNASKAGAGGELQAGDTATLGDGAPFEPGMSLGFFLVQNGWTGSGVREPVGGYEPQVFYSADFLNPEASAEATTATAASEPSVRHVAMLYSDSARERLIMGIEDLNRVDPGVNAYGYASDEDFNDAIFLVSSNPLSALGGANVADVTPIPLTGTGVYLASFILMLVFTAWRRSRPRSVRAGPAVGRSGRPFGAGAPGPEVK